MPTFIQGRPQFFNNSGSVLAGGYLYFYEAGTTTPLAVYRDAALTLAHSHPLVLQSDGRPLSPIFLKTAGYALVIKDSSSNTIYTQDPIYGAQTWPTATESAPTSAWKLSAKTATGEPKEISISSLAGIAGTPGGQFFGGILSNNSGDANHDIDISAFSGSDSTNAVLITLAATTKRLDAAWAAGTGNGGLDTGSIATSTRYALWAIAKADGTADALFSTSATAPTMPTGYTYKRRLGWVLTDGSSNLLAFKQLQGDFFLLNVPILDSDDSSLSATETYTSSAPPSVRGRWAAIAKLNSNGQVFARVFSTDEADAAVASTTAYLPNVSSGGDGTVAQYGGGQIDVFTSATSTIKARADADCTLKLALIGWTDTRGKEGA